MYCKNSKLDKIEIEIRLVIPCSDKRMKGFSDPDTIRTCDPQLRRLLLYPLSYGARH
jgi:hypothetical protein